MRKIKMQEYYDNKDWKALKEFADPQPFLFLTASR